MIRQVALLVVFMQLISCTLTSICFGDDHLTLNDYEKQVTTQNQTYRAGVLQLGAFENRMAEGSLDFMPSLIGSGNYNDNKTIQSAPSLFGTDLYTESGSLGVQTKFRTGTQVTFGYSVAYSATYGASFFIPPLQPYYTASPTLSVSQPLWKDFGAALSVASEDATQASYKAMIEQQKYLNQQIIFNAQTAYWRLALSRELLIYDKDAIDRAQKNYNLTAKRVSMNVADRSDALQTLAALKTRDLFYQADAETLRQASSQFNSLRNIQGDDVKEQVAPIDRATQDYMVKEISKRAERFDTTAAQLTAKNQKALAKLNIEKNKPDIRVFGTVQLNGRGNAVGPAMGESWNSDNPNYTAGLSLTIPLDLGLINHINEGYKASALASDILAQRAEFDLNQDWSDLKNHLKDAIVRLSMARELEKLQEEKLNHEKVRLSSGRSTSFQVLQFEDNFSDAQASRLRVQNEIVTIYAQAVLYNGGSH